MKPNDTPDIGVQDPADELMELAPWDEEAEWQTLQDSQAEAIRLIKKEVQMGMSPAFFTVASIVIFTKLAVNNQLNAADPMQWSLGAVLAATATCTAISARTIMQLYKEHRLLEKEMRAMDEMLLTEEDVAGEQFDSLTAQHTAP